MMGQKLQSMRAAFVSVLLLSICLLPCVNAEKNSTDTIITVDSTNLRFSPASVTINEGDAIRFFWAGQFLPHNAVDENETFDSGETTTEEDYRFVFDLGLNGTFNYYCEPHKSLGMVGQITVIPVPPAENNSTGAENTTTQPADEVESFMPFISVQSLLTVLIVAVIARNRCD